MEGLGSGDPLGMGQYDLKGCVSTESKKASSASEPDPCPKAHLQDGGEKGEENSGPSWKPSFKRLTWTRAEARTCHAGASPERGCPLLPWEKTGS